MRKYFFFVLLCCFCSCEDNDDLFIVPAEKTIIVYMAADNDLSNDAQLNIRQMQRGYRETEINFIVFVDANDKPPYLLKIKENGCDTIQTFSELNSASPQTLNYILRETTQRYPANTYGLVLWSHASSWLPEGVQLRSFGRDGNSEINIPELAKSLPVHFDFIVFDACLMGSVEALYELRGKTNYVITSSAETLTDGFPYAQLMPEFLQKNVNLRKIAESYFDFYNQKENAERSATVAWIDVRELANLAKEMSKLISENQVQPIDRSTVQRLDVLSKQYHFDLLDFVNKTFPQADKTDFVSQLNKTVLYKAHTLQLLGMYDINTYCGLSCYIPLSNRPDVNNYYKTLQWYSDAGIFKLF